jgi:hypothetical protein
MENKIICVNCGKQYLEGESGNSTYCNLCILNNIAEDKDLESISKNRIITLRDLEVKFGDSNLVSSNILKREAIKLINKMKLSDSYSSINGIWLDGNHYTDDMKDLFMFFFNITDEELKEAEGD